MKNKIWLGILVIIIIIAVILVGIKGVNVGSIYKNYVLVDITIGQDFEIVDIENIVYEVCGKNDVEIRRTGVYSDNIILKVSEISSEQIESLNNKINEKYGLNKKVEDIKIEYIPSFRVSDLVKSYIIPFGIITVLVLAYVGVIFRKLGFVKVILKILLNLVIVEAVYASVLVIIRYPINGVVMPLGMAIYVFVCTKLVSDFEKEKALMEEKN